jgi:chromosome segregation ATPase
MCKKIAIAAFAIGVGVLLLSRVSLVRVLWNDSKSWVARQVPPEVKLKEIKSEVDKIDNEIKKNLSKLAKMEVETKMLDEEVVGLRERQHNLRTDISAMNQKLDGATAKVSFQGQEFRVSDLTRKLDMAVTDYKNTRDRLTSKAALLADKRQALEAAHNRISSMRNQKEELRTLVSKLETEIEVVKQKRTESRVEIDNSQISHCRQLINELQTRLRQDAEETRLLEHYGYKQPTAHPTDNGKTPEEVRKSAREVLNEDDGAVVNK